MIDAPICAPSLARTPLHPASSEVPLASHKPGSRVVLTPEELNAYARQEIAEAVPDGVREPHLDLGPGTATASALIDFGRIRRAEGKPDSERGSDIDRCSEFGEDTDVTGGARVQDQHPTA